MSTNSSTEWFQKFYQPITTSDATIVSTTTNTTTMSPQPTTLSAGGPRPVQEGRISKPSRRRARASRKSPTTLLNTDTTNFRAMVQRYTGGSTTYTPNISPGIHYPSLPPSTSGGVDLHFLHQQLLQQYGPTAARPEPQSLSNLLTHTHAGNYSSSMGSTDVAHNHNNTGGFLFD